MSFNRLLKVGLATSLAFTLAGCDFVPELEHVEEEEPIVYEVKDKTIPDQLEGYWYYDNLSEEDKNTYNLIYEGIINWDEEIDIDSVPLDTLKKIDGILMSEHPEIFYCALSYEYNYMSNNTEEAIQYKPVYTMTKEEYQSKLAEVNAVVDSIVTQVKANTTSEYEAELFVHDYMVSNIEYYTDNEEDVENSMPSFRTMYGALIEGKANCMGYASTFTYLMNQLGIQCGSVVGNATNSDGETMGHEWNFVNINDNWYYVDVSWDDPNTDKDEVENTTDFISHRYFNLTSDDMAQSRDDSINLTERGTSPTATATEDNYIVRNGMVVSSTDEFQTLLDDNFNAMISDDAYIEVRFTNSEDYDYVLDNFSDLALASASENRYYGSFRTLGTQDKRLLTMLIMLQAS